MVATVGIAAAAEPKRPTGEEGGLFSLFTRGADKPAAEPEEVVEEPSGDVEGAAAEPVPPVEQSAPEKAAEPAEAKAAPEPPKTNEAAAPTEPEVPATAAEPEPESPSVVAPAMPAEPPSPPTAAELESPSVAAPAVPAGAPSPPASEGPAWPDAPDSGGTLAEQPTVALEPEETPAASVAAIEEPASGGEPPSGGRIDGAYATDAKDEPAPERETKPEFAARVVPSGGSVAPGAVALPETEIQGEIEKPDIFFLLPKARDQSDDQIIRARIRREITQPLVKEWLEEMMLLK